MGWVHVDESADGALLEHEGYVIGLERLKNERAEWREFTHYVDAPRYDKLPLEQRKHGLRVDYVQVACGCGWRSQILSAPIGTHWAPSCITLPDRIGGDDYEDAACRIWREQHIELLKASRSTSFGGTGRGLLFDLADDIRAQRQRRKDGR